VASEYLERSRIEERRGEREGKERKKRKRKGEIVEQIPFLSRAPRLETLPRMSTQT